MKRYLIYILVCILLSFVIFPVGKYVHSKTIWYNNSDCMITYINKYYPIWSIYKIGDRYDHIDTQWLTYLNWEKQIYWCNLWNPFNTSYCYITLLFENIWKK